MTDSSEAPPGDPPREESPGGPGEGPPSDPGEGTPGDRGTDPASDTDSERAIIYPLVANSGNERVLRQWIEGHDEYAVADAEPLIEATFDICLVDQPALFEHSGAIQDVKAAAEPALLPVLLLVSDLNDELIEIDRGTVADSVFATTVDELISLPIRQAELEWRLQALLRLRNQSLGLRAQTEQLRQFRRAVEASGHAIWISDSDGRIQYVNPAFEQVTGYSHEEAVGSSPAILNSGEMPDEHYRRLWDTVSSGETWREEIVNRRKDGSLYTADQTIAPITDERGDPTAYVAVQTDVTDRKQLEDRLKRHRDIIQRLDDPIMLQNTDGQFVLVNDALCEFAGLDADELEGADEYAFMDEATARTIDRQKQTVLWTEQPVEYSVVPTFEHSRREAVFYTSRYPYYDDTGELAGTLAICRDVTDLDERTRQLHVLDNILRHNIRNSLNVIHGRGNQLRAAVDGELEAAAETVVETAEALLTTSEKSHDITRILSEDTGIQRVDLTRLLNQAVGAVADGWPDVALSLSTPDELIVAAIPDIEAALEELVRNAAAHNDHETPRVEVTVTTDGEMADVRVTDNGPGLSEFDWEVLDSGTAIEALSHGSGLGLWLVYWVVKRSNGEITVSDREPRGTAITVSVPVVSSSADAVETERDR